MTLDWTINVGNLVAAAALVAGWVWGSARLYSRLVSLEDTIESHASKLEKLDGRVLDLVGDVARVVGSLWPIAPPRPSHYGPTDPQRLP